jgi:hypothetical protein
MFQVVITGFPGGSDPRKTKAAASKPQARILFPGARAPSPTPTDRNMLKIIVLFARGVNRAKNRYAISRRRPSEPRALIPHFFPRRRDPDRTGGTVAVPGA